MKILFLTPYPIGQAPSQRFRFEQYFDLLKSKGISYSVKAFISPSTWQILYKPGHLLQKGVGVVVGFFNRIRSLASLHQYDFIFIHREVTPIGPPIFEWIIVWVFRKKIIYDFDDAIWLPNTSNENKIVAFFKWHQKVALICKWSYAVSCGNEYLCEFARQFNKRVVLNPTTVDTEMHHNPSLFKNITANNSLTIGWTGTHSTLKYLLSLESVMQSLEKKFPSQFQFLVIADKEPMLNIKSLQFIPWRKETEVQDLLKINIGVMPLTNDMWANGKCGFKALQYMALNIPTLASPIGVNTEIIDDNINGYLCTSPEEWRECLEKLITDKELRKKIGANGRVKVMTGYSVASNSSNFLSLFV